ncbi:MAG: hypothetical protein R3E48_10300 [Burkholderiaceae bacterium]
MHRIDHEVTIDAADAKPMLAHRVQVLTTGQEDDVMTGLGQPATEVTTDSACAVDEETHSNLRKT